MNNIIEILKSSQAMSTLFISLFILIILSSIFQKRLTQVGKPYKIIFNILIFGALLLSIANAFLNEKYDKLIFFSVIVFLQITLPKFVKWYDNKVRSFNDR
ncbi:hypothetical protein HYN48_13765 [Flavobacterium magnum]|uniref:Uncharacterized protein n=1 Tax=Flavobacterium magnum TaxID=2162713 RepID=A0A2S0RHD5_9FLAO|nr:hypothetical protein [Flavobacterium magnum]AWA31066.1 hypothetical protein HYN48_13765 [Flavobacterium magnum]